MLHLPGPDFVDRIWTGHRPVEPGAAQPQLDLRPRPPGGHRLRLDPARSTRGSSTRPARRSRPTPSTSTPGKIVELAVEGGCNAVASTFGVLGAVSRKWAHKIPFIVKINHNELLTYPERLRPDPVRHGQGGLEPRRGRCRRHDLLRFRRRRPADPGDLARVRRSARARHGDDPLVLPAQPGVQEGRRRLRASRPTSPVRRTTSASRSRPTSSSRSCRPPTAASWRSTSARRPRPCTRS